jgi:hypothetical protein
VPIIKIDNIFSPEQLEVINDAINQNETEIHANLGRKYMGTIEKSLPKDILDILYGIAKDILDFPISMAHAMVVEYSAEYGQPNLPPHFDGDINDLIINMQLEANTAWPLGLNTKTYTLEDNSALVFNGNTEIHWRTHKEFKEGEYVRMMFVRFYNEENRPNYSYLPSNQADDIFKEARELRDSLI